jgi:hypothetical protein
MADGNDGEQMETVENPEINGSKPRIPLKDHSQAFGGNPETQCQVI